MIISGAWKTVTSAEGAINLNMYCYIGRSINSGQLLYTDDTSL